MIARKTNALRRTASVNAYFLVFMGVTLPTFFFTLDNWRLVEGKASQQRFCDASVLAAIQELTKEFTVGAAAAPTPYSPLLYGDPTDILNLCQTDAIAMAKTYAAMNFVDGVALTLVTTPAQTDVKFGSYDLSTKGPFTPIDPTTATTVQKRSIHAIRVEGLRTVARKNSVPLFGPAWTGYSDAQIVTRTTAILDRRVIGFRYHDNWAATPVPLGNQRIPMAPIALLSDPTATNAFAWQTQVEAAASPGTSPPTTVAYGTMAVNLSITTPGAMMAAPQNNAALLRIGTTSYSQIADQVTDAVTPTSFGVTSAQVTTFGSDLILSDSTAVNPFTLDIPEVVQPATGGGDYDDLFDALDAARVAGNELVFPLYETKVANPVPMAPPPLTGNDVRITGFVAARVTAVTKTAKDAGMNDYISFTLQPTLLQDPTAFTDYSNKYVGSTTNYATYSRLINPYIGRLRLVD